MGRIIAQLGPELSCALLRLSPEAVAADSRTLVFKGHYQRIFRLDAILARLRGSSVHSDQHARWLTHPQPLLGGATPIDVLLTRGIDEVVVALDNIDAGANV